MSHEERGMMKMRLVDQQAFQRLHAPPAHRAFVAIEACAMIVVGIVLASILLATTGESRRLAMLNRDLANMRQIGAWTFAYANDYGDLHPSFSSAPNSLWADIRATASAIPRKQAVGHAIDIVRRRSGRVDMPLPGGWVPHIYYTQLVLVDYTQRRLPDTTYVSTGDKHRLNWLDDPINKHDQGFWQPYQNPSSGSVPSSAWRWPYSASFQTPPGWYDKSAAGSRMYQGGSHASFVLPGGILLGGHLLADVAYPAQKVMLHDYGAWHFSKQPLYFARKAARTAVLQADGGASARHTSDANEGWMPNEPALPKPARILYAPRAWQPPAKEPGGTDLVEGHYRWTRGGIKGRDFDGPEIDTGQK